MHAVRDAFSTSGIIMVVFVVAFLMLSNQISKPVNLIRRGVSRMAQGDYYRPIPLLPNIPSEMQDISNDINQLSHQLEGGQKRTEKARQLQRIIDQSESGYMTCGKDRLVSYFNSSLYSMFTENLSAFQAAWGQFDPDALLGQKPLFLSQGIPGGEDWVFDPRNLPYKSDIEVGTMTFNIAVSAVHEDQGEFVGISVEMVDVSKTRVMEREKEQALEGLKLMVEELDQFTYVVSHDLRSPLQGIDMLAQWVLDDDGENVSEDSLLNLQRLQGRIRWLGELLDDLLEYSRSGRVYGDITLVDCGKLVEELDGVLNPSGAFDIVVAANAPLPVFNTYSAPFKMVMRNLIDNAIKHHHKPAGTIKVSCNSGHPRHFEYQVSDDGPGVPHERQEKIFGMFKSFETDTEKRSTGVGLALIKKTVESFGCGVWVESQADRGPGSAFSFTWPKQVGSPAKG